MMQYRQAKPEVTVSSTNGPGCVSFLRRDQRYWWTARKPQGGQPWKQGHRKDGDRQSQHR
jgi:hypothetical protein